jgi:hypothetical protein
LASLHKKREQEHYRKATWEYIQLLRETIDKEPQELGYKFGGWTGERLATYLASKTGIELSGSPVSRILKKKKYRYIWAKYSREYQHNPAPRPKFNQKLLNYLHRARQQHFCRILLNLFNLNYRLSGKGRELLNDHLFLRWGSNSLKTCSNKTPGNVKNI